MKIIEPSYYIFPILGGESILLLLELAGRTCYKSEEQITDDSSKKFITMLVERGHEAIIEHFNVTVRFICNRGFTHELVRHRLCSYAQESTRYCNYSKDKYGSEITFIKPPNFDNWNNIAKSCWMNGMENAEMNYLEMIRVNCKPQEARGVLPIDVKTEIIITANLREWRHIFKLRTSSKAHPSMQQLMRPLLHEFKEKIPVVFDNINY